MSINLDDIEEPLLAWWSAIVLGGYPLQAIFEDAKRPIVSPNTKAIASLNIIGIPTNGVDEVRWTPNADNPLKLDAEVNGIRHITISCRVDSFSQLMSEAAELILERGRTRLRLPHVLASLQAVGLALIQVGPTVPLPFTANDLTYSRAAFDVTFGLIAVEGTMPEEAQDTIGTVEIRSEFLLDADGSPTGSQVETIVTEP